MSRNRTRPTRRQVAVKKRAAPNRRRSVPARGGRTPRPRGWRWLLVGPGVLGLGVVLALVLAWHLDANSPTPGEESAQRSEGSLGPVHGGGIPTPRDVQSYRIVYRMTEPATPVQIDQREVDRPFLGRGETRGPNGHLFTAVVTNNEAAYLYISTPKPHWAELEGGTNRATGDEQAVPALQAAAAHGLARVLGTRQVLRRACTVVRTGEPLGSPITSPTASTYADECLDRATGLILDEIWVLDAKFVRERRAVQLDLDPRLPKSTFEVASSGPAAPVGSAGSTVGLTLDPSEVDSLPVWMPAPRGYRLDGVEAQTNFEDLSNGTSPPQAVSTVVAHFVDGPRLIDLEEGNLPAAPARGIPVALGHGRKAVLTLDMTSSYLDVTLPDGIQARVEGADISALIGAAKSIQLRTQPAGSG